jgi:hypothetical protein
VRPFLALVLVCSACTGATEKSRAAWDKAVSGHDGASKGSGGGGGGRGTTRGNGLRDNWQALAQFTTDASEMLSGGSTTVSVPRLAKQLCSEVPEALEQDPPPEAVVCAPKSPFAALGHEFELELGRDSTIGLVARELSDQDSGELVRQVMQRLRGICREPWASAARADNALADFHRCPTATGAEVVVGRFPINLAAGQWHFSLAVLGPG